RTSTSHEKYVRAMREQAERDVAPIDRLLMPSVLAPLVSRMDRNSDTAGKISYTLITRKGARLLAGDLTEGPSSLAPIDYEQVAERFYSRVDRSEEHTSELQSRFDLVCRLLLEKKNYIPIESIYRLC